MNDALIHLRVPAAVKGRWVAESRKAGQKLTDWIVSKVEMQDMTTSIEAVISEIVALADGMWYMPALSEQAEEGLEAIRQAARAFEQSKAVADKRDAAAWLHEAFLLLSSGLPDMGDGEPATGWATANLMSKLMGSESAWALRIEQEIK